VRAWRETAKALIAQRRRMVCWTSNDDGRSMSHNTLNRGLQDHGLLRRRRPLRAWLLLDRVESLNEEGAFEGDVMEELAHDTEEQAPAGAGVSLPSATRTRFASSTIGRPIGTNACA
jgi:hypothetical protein